MADMDSQNQSLGFLEILKVLGTHGQEFQNKIGSSELRTIHQNNQIRFENRVGRAKSHADRSIFRMGRKVKSRKGPTGFGFPG